MESLYVVFMRHMIRKIATASILGLTMAIGSVFARGLDQANSGIRALEAGRVDDAIELLTQGIQSDALADEQLAMAYHHRGIAHQRRGDTARAILDYTNAMQRGILAEELRPRALNNRAICFEMIGDLEAALRDLNRAITLRGDYADAYVNRASVLRKMSAYQLALQDYGRANTLGHVRPMQIAQGVAQTYDAAGDKVQALRYYRQVVSIDPTYAPARERIALLTQSAPVRLADASAGARRTSREPQVGSDAQPAAMPESIGENTLRATILDTSGPVTGSGFAQDAATAGTRVSRLPSLMTVPLGRGPKGGPESSELVPLLKDDSAVRALPRKQQAIAAPDEQIGGVEAVQLASYGSEAMARQGWIEIAGRFPAELGPATARIVAAQHPKKGVVYRLNATGLTASATALCAKLKRRGQQCLPAVLPALNAAPG